jgi:cephalosporin hydroxylase
MSAHDPKDPAKIAAMAADGELEGLARGLFDRVNAHGYSYNFTWLGRPIIQFPQDLVAIQEVIWRVRPAAIVETGIAHGGSLIFSASMLELIGGPGRVIGVDIDIRAHNRVAIEEHPLARRITMIEGSSIDDDVVAQVVREVADAGGPVMVILDSLHTHEHVLCELERYSPLVTQGSYLIVLDTVIEDMAADAFPDRPWGRGDNPKTAVHEFLRGSERFEIDRELSDKLVLSVAPDGYLKCIAP